MATVRFSDVSGEVISSAGASMRITFNDRTRTPLRADLTETEVDRIVELLEDLGADLGRLEELGKEPDGLAKRMANVRKTSPNAWTKWTRTEESELLEMFHEGLAVEEIAEALGRPQNGVLRRLMSLGAFGNLTHLPRDPPS